MSLAKIGLELGFEEMVRDREGIIFLIFFFKTVFLFLQMIFFF